MEFKKRVVAKYEIGLLFARLQVFLVIFTKTFNYVLLFGSFAVSFLIGRQFPFDYGKIFHHYTLARWLFGLVWSSLSQIAVNITFTR